MCRDAIYQIKAHEMLFQMQETSFRFNKWIVLCTTLNTHIYSTVGGNFEGIWGNPGGMTHIGCRIFGV